MNFLSFIIDRNNFFLFSFTELFRFYALLDSSRIAIFIISVSLIVYGSFRSLNYDACIKKEEKQIDAQVINGRQAFLFPLVGSIFLLVSFFFFDSLQLLFFVCTSGNHF
ncbi:hypothetical protein D917_09302 [Trichinella nativa]|uniref:Uncharacterized protein n=1 Tax=Trichinella nativa TaxID=6335 RepID=A0A1Y3EM29_9BILA|nr:hypothetical protein D917_09302 [Trichinella nativa]